MIIIVNCNNYTELLPKHKHEMYREYVRHNYCNGPEQEMAYNNEKDVFVLDYFDMEEQALNAG